jgi:hypothetical protein
MLYGGCMERQRRECDTLKTLNKNVGDEKFKEDVINVKFLIRK